MNEYRNNGAIGALLDEYERALKDLKNVISDISKDELLTKVDHLTEDPVCISIQTILAHLVRAGQMYIIEIRKHLGEDLPYTENNLLESIHEYVLALDKMFASNLLLFEDYLDIKIEEYANDKKMVVRWGQSYDIEQLLEHAIVHILRHRRQIERFLLRLRETLQPHKLVPC